MLLNKLLRVVNVVIGLALLVAVAAIWWFVWRPLPATSGELKAPVSAQGTIARDAFGVPFIQAATIPDVLFLQGYTAAQDRLFQMDGIRRLAGGELAEIIGPAAVDLDSEARRLQLRHIAERDLAALAAEERAWLAAYARGVNFFIEGHRNRLPLEFTLLAYQPRPWTLTDTLLVSAHMYRMLTTNWRDEIAMESMLPGGDRGKIEFLYDTRLGGDTQPGSNAWVISGKHTASGKPLLANDPHLEFGVPSTWLQVHLQAPGLHVAGVTLPGAPFVIVGHNEHIAWGVTNMMVDVQDLYVEKFDPRSGRYEFRGQVEQARRERETIAVRGAKPVELAVWATRHGPVFLSKDGRHYAMKWAAAEAEPAFAFADINRASNWEQFRSALRRYPGPGQNFVYADTQGNIGYQATGRFPIRRNATGQLPVDGAGGEHEWDGFIPFDDLPSFYNPPSGIIVTANQNPFPPDYRRQVNGNFASPDRWRQIRSLLTAREGWKPEDMIIVQKDVYSSFCHFLARKAVAAHDLKKPAEGSLGEAVDLLRHWNGQMEKGTSQPMITTLLYQHLRKNIANRAAPGKGLDYRFEMGPAVVRRLLTDRPADWFPDFDKFLLDSLRDAVDEGRRMQGDHIAKWDYGVFNRVDLVNPVLSRVPYIGRYFEIGEIPMSGSSTTVKQTTRRLGPSMRFVADPGNWEDSLLNITVGESGQVLSSHYKDQWQSYYSGKGIPMPFGRLKTKSTLTVLPE